MGTQAPRPLIERGPLNEKLTPDTLLAGDTVTMNFPQTVKLQLDDGAGTVTFFAGVQQVPKALANHWWLRDNGARPYNAKVAKPLSSDPAIANKLPQMTERELRFLQSRGYRQMTSVSDVQVYYETMDPLARPGFQKSVDEWWAEETKSQEPLPELSEMTKVQLAEHASEAHDVELDPAKMNKDEMIAEIEKLRKPQPEIKKA